jgi:hypothetical protein
MPLGLTPLNHDRKREKTALYKTQANWVYHKTMEVVKRVPLLKTCKKTEKKEIPRREHCDGKISMDCILQGVL